VPLVAVDSRYVDWVLLLPIEMPDYCPVPTLDIVPGPMAIESPASFYVSDVQLQVSSNFDEFLVGRPAVLPTWDLLRRPH
jgi:hypothetical protein